MNKNLFHKVKIGHQKKRLWKKDSLFQFFVLSFTNLSIYKDMVFSCRLYWNITYLILPTFYSNGLIFVLTLNICKKIGENSRIKKIVKMNKVLIVLCWEVLAKILKLKCVLRTGKSRYLRQPEIFT